MSDVAWSNVLTGIITFIAGGGGVFVLNWLRQGKEQNRADKKQDSELQLSEVTQAFTIYKETLAQVKHDAEVIQKGYQDLEKQYIDAKEKAIIAQSQKDILIEKLANANLRIEYLEKEINKHGAG
jgi:hypothetical protein